MSGEEKLGQLYLGEIGSHVVTILQISLTDDQMNCMYRSRTQEVRTKQMTEPEERVWVPGPADCLRDVHWC